MKKKKNPYIYSSSAQAMSSRESTKKKNKVWHEIFSAFQVTEHTLTHTHTHTLLGSDSLSVKLMD